MAVITTTFTPEPSPDPYSGVSQLIIDNSDVSRGEIVFSVFDGAVALSGVGDNQFITITCLLPLNYSYTLADFFLSITSTAGETNGFDDALACRLLDDNTGTDRTFAFMLPNHAGPIANFSAGLKEVLTYCLDCFPTQLLKSAGQGALNLNVQCFNATANDAAYEVNFYARFQQFDINQALNAQVNRQTPVRTR